MALQVGPLTASPNPTTLPRRLDLRQLVKSDQPGEEVLVLYQLSPEHDLWFDEIDGLTKQMERHEVVEANPTTLHHRVRLVRGEGVAQRAYGLEQTIFDGAGRGYSAATSIVLEG